MCLQNAMQARIYRLTILRVEVYSVIQLFFLLERYFVAPFVFSFFVYVTNISLLSYFGRSVCACGISELKLI